MDASMSTLKQASQKGAKNSGCKGNSHTQSYTIKFADAAGNCFNAKTVSSVKSFQVTWVQHVGLGMRRMHTDANIFIYGLC